MLGIAALFAAARGAAASRFAIKIPADTSATRAAIANFDEFDMILLAQMTIDYLTARANCNAMACCFGPTFGPANANLSSLDWVIHEIMIKPLCASARR